MQVLLQNIAFNHSPDLTETGSFFLRRNETQIVPIPEWRNECCSNPECAPAGYVINRLPGILTIKASFICDDPTITSIYIQALEVPSDDPSTLGAVEARSVPLQNGSSGLVDFNLPNARSRIISAGTSARDITWQWQFSTDAEHWNDFQTTEHRIYAVFQMPNAPWKPTSNIVTEINVPWTEVLDHACKWAVGLNEEDEVAKSITRSVYQLGQERLVRWAGGASYARALFDCTAFLQLLKRRSGNGQTLNCDDCATIVSTFANVLGCNLFQSNMVSDFFTNPILLIGYTEVSIKRFGNHAVAWKLNCDAAAALFDACLRVDIDGNPKANEDKHIFSQPSGLVFDTGQTNSYKFCLFDIGTCDPDPDHKLQRSLGSGPFGQPPIADARFLDLLKHHYKFDTWNNGPESRGKSRSVPRLFETQTQRDAFEDWSKRKVNRFVTEHFSSTEGLLKRNNSPQQLVEITIYETQPPQNPNDTLLQLLGRFQSLDFERSEPPIGDLSFVSPDLTSVIFKRENIVTAIRSVGIQQIPVITMAMEVDHRLSQT